MDKKQLSILLGENICKYRTQLGLTQAELAEKIGVNSSYISRIECADKSMKIITLYNLAEALNVSCDALLNSESCTAHTQTIAKMLENQSVPFLEGVESIIRVCNDYFVEKDKDRQEDT